jgi:hypothetical protein
LKIGTTPVQQHSHVILEMGIRELAISTKLARMYLKEKPYQAEQGGWLGLFDDLDPLIGLAFNPNADNSILTDRENGVLVWSDRTIEKPKQARRHADKVGLQYV